MFTRGEYSSIRNDLLADPTITSAAKCIAAALGRHLHNGTDAVYPSIGRLATLAGLNRSSAVRAVRALTAAGYVEAQTRKGRPTVYRFPARNQAQNAPTDHDADPAQNAPTPPPETDRNQAQNAPTNQAHSAPDQAHSAHGPGAKCASKYVSEVPCEVDPPNPPGGGAGPSCPPGDGETAAPAKDDSERPSGDPAATTAPTQQTSTEAADRVAVTYRAVVGGDMPASWRTAVRREWRKGDRATVEAMADAEKLRAALSEAKRRRVAWTYNMAVAIVQGRRVENKARTAENVKRAQVAADLAAQREQIDAQVEARRAAEADVAAGYFATLDAAAREAFRAAVLAFPGPRPNEKALAHLAARRAWIAAGRPAGQEVGA